MGPERPHDPMMTYAFFLCRFIVRPNSTKLSGGSNQRLCCVGLFPTALRRLRRYVMDFGLSTPEHHHCLEVVLYNPGPEGSPVKGSSEHLQLYVCFRYRSTYLSSPPLRSSVILPLFPCPGLADGCGILDQRDVFVSALSLQAGIEGRFTDVIRMTKGDLLNLRGSRSRQPVSCSRLSLVAERQPCSLVLLPCSVLWRSLCLSVPAAVLRSLFVLVGLL